MLAEQASRDASINDEHDAPRSATDGSSDEAADADPAMQLARLRTADQRPSPVLPAMRLVRPPDSPPTGPAAEPSTDGRTRTGSAGDDPARGFANDESPQSRESTA